MQGDSTRVAVAQQLLANRDRRREFFPAGFFYEHPWDMMLHLFVAMFENDVLGEARLIELVRASPNTGRRWLAVLIRAGHVEVQGENEGFVLTARALGSLRGYLDAVLRSSVEW